MLQPASPQAMEGASVARWQEHQSDDSQGRCVHGSGQRGEGWRGAGGRAGAAAASSSHSSSGNTPHLSGGTPQQECLGPGCSFPSPRNDQTTSPDSARQAQRWSRAQATARSSQRGAARAKTGALGGLGLPGSSHQPAAIDMLPTEPDLKVRRWIDLQYLRLGLELCSSVPSVGKAIVPWGCGPLW